MLGFAEVRSWHLQEALDSIRVENAIQVEHCPISEQVLSNLSSIFQLTSQKSEARSRKFRHVRIRATHGHNIVTL